jgi:hypothetical protein
MKTTAYIYNEETNECLFVVTGEQADVEWETTAHFEQNGTPTIYDASQLTGVEHAEVLSV